MLLAVRALWGGVLLLAPRAVLGLVGPASAKIVAVTRILGLRHLAEALILSRHPRRAPPRWPVIIDLTHAASMLWVAGFSRRLRRDALASAATAGLLASWTELERRRA